MILDIAGYQIVEQIYESMNTWVYRAYRQTDNQSVILKVLKEQNPSPEYVAWFTHEYELTRNLDIPGVARVYSLEKHQDYLVMVVEDVGGKSLAQQEIAGTLTLENFLRLAIDIANVLGSIHTKQVIHRDINPSNIIYDPQSHQVTIIDFGIATMLPREAPDFATPDVMEGTPSYISPEQTGRMNVAVDVRSDLYSLGATLYELATGSTPFSHDDILELIHSHLAREPIAPHERNTELPPMLSAIVLKLMAKSPEERYQTASGLKADLEVCLKQWRETGHIEPFTLGEHDMSDRFLIPHKLYGREAEIAVVQAAPARVSQGNSELLLVSGDPGIGKTALVQEIYKPLTRQRGYFVSGKFDQYQRTTPYSAFIHAFSVLIHYVLTESDAHIEFYRTRLLETLGANSRVITDVICDLEQIIGPQPPVTKLDSTEAQNRFNLAFRKFVGVFAQPEHPVVVFLDDLQWADHASLSLLEQLMTDVDSKHLLIIGTYRDNEVGPGHPLELTLDVLHEAGTTINAIALHALGEDAVAHLIAETLHTNRTSVQQLAHLVHAKTGGNPFFINEFLKSLYVEELITFNYEQGQWMWDIAQIESRDITDNVVELMAHKVTQLSPACQEILKLAACIGSTFDLSRLSMVADQSPQDVARILMESMTEGLVLPLSTAYKLMTLAIPGLVNFRSVEYKFSHDRVRQAVYSLIPSDEGMAIHLRIGRLLHKTMATDQHGGQIFDVVNQMNQGLPLVNSQDEQIHVAELNLQAGRYARDSAAFASAWTYFKTGVDIVAGLSDDEENDSWSFAYDLTLALYSRAAFTAYVIGDLDEMERLTSVILDRANTVLDMVVVYDIRIQAHMSQNNMQEAIQVAILAMDMLGEPLPAQPTMEDVGLALQQTLGGLAGTSVDELIDLPTMEDPHHLAVMGILGRSISAAYLVAPELFALIALKQVNLSVAHGNANVSSYAYIAFGIILCGIVGDIELGYQFGQLALRLIDRLNARDIAARTMMAANFLVRHWKEPIRDYLPDFVEAYKTGLETGDFIHAGYSGYHYCYMAFHSGVELSRCEEELISYRHSFVRIRQSIPMVWNDIEIQVVYNVQGRSDNLYHLKGEAFDEDTGLPKLQQANDVTTIFSIYYFKLILAYLFDDYERAVGLIAEGTPYIGGALGLPYVPTWVMYSSLALLAHYPNVDAEQQAQFLENIAANQQRMKQWADCAPENNLHKYYLVEAERARLAGNTKDAWDYYTQATTLAHTHEYSAEEGLSHERMALFFALVGQKHLADSCMQRAHQCYKRWGAHAKVRRLEEQHPYLREPEKGRAVSDSNVTMITIAAPDKKKTSSVALDLNVLIKVSQTISGGIILETLLEKIIDIIIENAGAQRGQIILEKDGEWVVEAERTIHHDKADVLMSLPLDTKTLPMTVLNYVERTQQRVVLHNATEDERFANDPYIQSTKPRSILCLPVLSQKKMIGLIYLENNLTTSAFTLTRVTVLELLAAQAAIGIENARLYTTIEASESRFRAIFEESKDVIFMLTPNGKFEAINRACETVFGYTSEEMEQMSFAQICTAQGDKETWVSRLLEAEELRDSEIRICRKDGSQGDFLITAAVRHDTDGNVLGFQGIGRDITMQNQAREEAERASRQEQVIEAQRDVIRELSTPLLPLSDGVVMLPLVGTLDSVRSALVMETLLQGIADYRAEIALLDITGVPVMDTTVANVLVQTAQAARLLGATVILTGIGPTIAQTLVSLGVDLTGIITRSSLQDGVAYALRQKVLMK